MGHFEIILGALLACEDDLGTIITAFGMHKDEFSKNTHFILMIFHIQLNDFYEFGVTFISMASI